MSLRGWELLFDSVQSHLNGKADIAIALAHWFIIQNTNMWCNGTTSKVRNEI